MKSWKPGYEDCKGVPPWPNYSVEKLPNGLTRVFCRATKLVACFNQDGTSGMVIWAFHGASPKREAATI